MSASDEGSNSVAADQHAADHSNLFNYIDRDK